MEKPPERIAVGGFGTVEWQPARRQLRPSNRLQAVFAS
jgi:hypothetical protein